MVTPIALRFSPDFPVATMRDWCVVLDGKPVFTLGRSSTDARYDIDVPYTVFTRDHAVLTFRYIENLGWSVLDAGLDSDGNLIPYEYKAMVNGMLISREDKPLDPVTIDPHLNNRIMIGGHPDLKILVVAECFDTLPPIDPFADPGWGVERMKKHDQGKDPAIAVEHGDTEAHTASLSIKNPYLNDLLIVSSKAGQGLADKETRASTALSILMGLLMAFAVTVLALVLRLDPNVFMDRPEPANNKIIDIDPGHLPH